MTISTKHVENIVQKVVSYSTHSGNTNKVIQQAEKTLLPLTSKEDKMARKILKGIEQVKNRQTVSVLKKATCDIPEQAITLRDQFISTIENAGVSTVVTKKLRDAKTLGELQAAIYSFEKDFLTLEVAPILKKIPKKHSGIPLEIEQMFYQKKNLQDDCIRYLHALFSPKSRNPAVIKIEKILKEQYGVDLALLADDLPNAIKILNAVDRAKTKGIQIPKDFIITNYKLGGEHLNTYDGSQSSILLGSTLFENYIKKHSPKIKMSDNQKDLVQRYYKTTGFSSWHSTTNMEHTVVHEIMHQEHLPFLAFKFKKIPKRFTPTINSLSGYAASKPQAAHEIYTELNTKRILSKLTPEEKELFKYLGGEI